MRYYYWRLALVLFSLVSSLVFSINKLEVGYNYDESKNIKGYSKEISKYDFNNDGKSEKIIVFFKLSGNKIDSYTNIFIEEGETYRLAYQIHDLSTLEISQVNKLNDKIAMMKKYYQIFSSGLGNNEVRYIDFVTSNQPENINMNLKYSKNVPKILIILFLLSQQQH